MSKLIIKKNQKRYTPNEDNIIIQCVRDNPHNLQQAFAQAAKMMPGRSPGGIGYRYSKVLKSKVPMFLSGNNSTMMLNTKNIKQPKEIDLKEAMVMVINMKPDMQKIIRDYLNNIEIV